MTFFHFLVYYPAGIIRGVVRDNDLKLFLGVVQTPDCIKRSPITNFSLYEAIRPETRGALSVEELRFPRNLGYRSELTNRIIV